MKKTEIYLARHAVTKLNQGGYFQGLSDIPLNENGQEQAELLKDRFLTEKIALDRILCSRLCRTQQTAKPLADALGIDIEIVEGIQEVNGGAFEGQFHVDNAREYPNVMHKIMHKPYEAEFPNGESGEEVYERMVEAFEKIAKESLGQKVLIVSHGFALQMLVSHLKGIAPKDTARQICANTAVTHVTYYQDGKIEVDYLQDASHLPEKWQVSSESRSSEAFKRIMANPILSAAATSLGKKLLIEDISKMNWDAFHEIMDEFGEEYDNSQIEELTEDEVEQLRERLLA